MASPKQVAEPHKELRFTRAAQAQMFYILSAIFLALGVFLTVTWAQHHPSLSWWMLLPPFIAAFLLVRIAIRCTRHAYLILTPLGVEVFPLFKPEKNLLLIYWSEIAQADFEERKKQLILHRDAERTSGVVISLSPISEAQQDLLSEAISGRMKQEATT